MFCLQYLLRYILHTFYGIYTNYIYSSVFLFNLSALDISLLDFTGLLAKQDSFRRPCPKHRIGTQTTPNTTIIGITATRHVPEREARHMVTIQNDSLPTPSFAIQPERKEILTLSTMQETTIHTNAAADTLVSQVTPLLGITPRESTQLQNTNTQEDIEEILGTRAFQRYVDTPIQTLDRIVVNQPKRFLPLAQEARKIAEEIRIEKINEQWAGIP